MLCNIPDLHLQLSGLYSYLDGFLVLMLCTSTCTLYRMHAFVLLYCMQIVPRSLLLTKMRTEEWLSAESLGICMLMNGLLSFFRTRSYGTLVWFRCAEFFNGS